MLVLTASDGVSAGVRDDASGDALDARLTALGYVVERILVPDDQVAIGAAIRAGAARHPLVVTLAVIDYPVPGLAESMRAAGRAKTPLADLSRAVVGVIGQTLVVNLPGSPKGAIESFDAIAPVLDHALETLAGPHDHG